MQQAPPVSQQPKPSWGATLRVYAEPATLRMLFLGFSAGLPLLLVLGTLSFRLREAGIDRATIGFLSWVGLAYAFKWVWAPLVDRCPIPLLSRLLGQRRAWLLLAQLAIMGGLAGMALVDPQSGLRAIIWCAVVVAFGSATQDIALDAFRIESAPIDRQAALAATYQTGYRLAMIWAGAGVLWIAARSEVTGAAAYQHGAWRTAYLTMAASMLVGMLTVLFTREPRPRDAQADRSLRGEIAQRLAREGLTFTWPQALVFAGVIGLMTAMVRAPLGAIGLPEACFYVLLVAIGAAGLWRGWGAAAPWHVPVPPRMAPVAAWVQLVVIEPFAEFLQRYGWHAVLILALISVYRISDIVMGIMANPFYVDMGYTKDEVAAVTKIYGVLMTLAGAFIGGVLSMRLGVMRVLMLGAFLSAASNLLFAWLGTRGHDVTALILIVSADNLSSGIASAAFVAYLSSLTNIGYSATQYALFSSVMLLLPKYLAGFSGQYVDAHGYVNFFTATALLGLPVLVLVWLASRIGPAAVAPPGAVPSAGPT